jgi:hypothetical protein
MRTAIPINETSCHECSAPLAYQMEEISTGWKVYAVCTERIAHVECRAGTVTFDEISDRDELAERARELVRTLGDR